MNPSAILPADTVDRIRQRLDFLYGGSSTECLSALIDVVSKYDFSKRAAKESRWDERDVVLITYGDQIRQPDGSALPALSKFFVSAGLSNLINIVHILPFFPYTSDDGFSVVDYRQVDPDVGDWQDVSHLGRHTGLMFDLVLNHCSQASEWFQKYRACEPPFDDYFISVASDTDVSQVTRPRSLPLLSPYETARGTKHVWTTFSADQVDLNFSNPRVLAEFIDILLFFVQHGARVIRLDAIAYLWKELGTNCIHLPQTHEVVKLMRDVLNAVAPDVLLLTETNVPHDENVSYFGDGDEAHMVYQFSLPPLLLDAFLNQDPGPLRSWLQNLSPSPSGTSFFNFTASHDGVGVRPLEGLVSDERLARMVAAVKQRGGLVSTRRKPDGTDSPYELNISYVDALGDPESDTPDQHARRFLASQAVMLALPGIPGVYFHSLVGTQNDNDGVQQSGQPRRINRHKYQLDELRGGLANGESLQAIIFQGYQKLLRIRTRQPAFHPDARLEVLDAGSPSVLLFRRTSVDESQQIIVATNFTQTSQRIQLPFSDHRLIDLLTEESITPNEVEIGPDQAKWLEMSQHPSKTVDESDST